MARRNSNCLEDSAVCIKLVVLVHNLKTIKLLGDSISSHLSGDQVKCSLAFGHSFIFSSSLWLLYKLREQVLHFYIIRYNLGGDLARPWDAPLG